MVRHIIYYFGKEVKGFYEMNTKTKKLVIASLMAGIVCVATMIIKIPSPLKGYVNLGDCIVLVSGWMLLPSYGFLASGVGSALADILSGYVIYAPATFLIKGAMSLIAFCLYKLLQKKLGSLPSLIISGIISEITMILGYYIFEGFMYGFIPSALNIPANGIQGIFGLIIGVVLIKIFKKSKISLE